MHTTKYKDEKQRKNEKKRSNILFARSCLTVWAPPGLNLCRLDMRDILRQPMVCLCYELSVADLLIYCQHGCCCCTQTFDSHLLCFHSGIIADADFAPVVETLKKEELHLG